MARYDSFVLRIWRSSGPQGPQWSARLEHVQQAGLLQFRSLEALLAHLRTVAGPLRAEPSGQDDPGSPRPDEGAQTGNRRADPGSFRARCTEGPD